jgi:hypothetical protein
VLEGSEVHKYSPAGVWEAEVESPPWDNSSFIESIAFDEAAGQAGQIFASESYEALLWGLDPADATYDGTELEPLAGRETGGEAECCFLRVAADNSGGPYDGALYVFSSEGTVSDDGTIIRIDSEGNPLEFSEGSSAGSNELSGADTPFGHFIGPAGLTGAAIAIDAVGHIWVAENPGPKAYLHEFAPTGRYLQTVSGMSPLQGFGEDNAIAVDPTTGSLLVSDIGVNKIHEFTPAGVFIADTAIPGGGDPFGVAADSTGKLYVSGVGIPGNHIGVWGPAGPPTPRYPLEIEVMGPGEVAGAGIACTDNEDAAACEEEFVEGSEVPLIPRPADGYRLVGWTAVVGDGGSCISSGTYCETGGLTEATRIRAEFGVIPPPVVDSGGEQPPPPKVEERGPVRAGLRIGRIRSVPSKWQIAVRGTIVTQASGLVSVQVVTFLDGRRVKVSRRARIFQGRWRTRLPAPWAKRRDGAKVTITARFEGGVGIQAARAVRRARLQW